MRLYDKNTNETIANITTNHRMSTDEILDLMGYTVNDEGQIYDEDNEQLLNAWYDDLETED